MMDHMGIGMGFGWLFQLLIIIVFFLVIWWLLKRSGSFGYTLSSRDSALDILKKRLARGEIDDKEFRRLRKEIE